MRFQNLDSLIGGPPVLPHQEPAGSSGDECQSKQDTQGDLTSVVALEFVLNDYQLVPFAIVALLFETGVADALAILAISELHAANFAEISLGNAEDLGVLLVGGEVDVTGRGLSDPDTVQVEWQQLVSSDGVSVIEVGDVDSQHCTTSVQTNVQVGDGRPESIEDEGLGVAVVSWEENGGIQGHARSVDHINPSSALAINTNTYEQQVLVGNSTDDICAEGWSVVNRRINNERLSLVGPSALDESDEVPIWVDDCKISLCGVTGDVPQVD